MTFDELLLFYIESSTNEFEIITNNNDPDTLTEDHFLHHKFCSSAVHNMIVGLVEYRLANGDLPERLIAGFRLYQEMEIKHKYKVWN